MFKRKSFIPHDRPVYREVLPKALKAAWRHPQYWIVGIFAAFLNSGSMLDVGWKFWNAIQQQGSDIFIGHAAVQIWGTASIGGFHWLPFFQATLALLTLFVILVAVLAFSCVCQGAMVHAMGSWKDGWVERFRQSLHVGAKALVPIAALNIIVVASIWVARFFVSLPLAIALGRSNGLYMAVYLVSFIVFFVLAVFMSILQIYALNAMILQGASLAQAFKRAWLTLKEHWLVTLETALLQALIVILLFVASMIALMVLVFPSAILYVLAVLQNNLWLFQVSLGIFFGIIIIFILVLTGFTVTFHYALWAMMYRKLGEGGVTAKIHRLYRLVTRQTKVPQS
jgi:hypothetical protein